jgi:flagellar basal-body rod protein FlgB
MPDIRLFDGLNAGIERVLDFRLAQHELVAGNLANSDTPGYLAREMPFGEVLGRVMEEATSGARELPSVSEAEHVEREADVNDRDGNSVDPEHESVTLASNLVWYNALTSGVSRRLALLRFAASDGRG